MSWAEELLGLFCAPMLLGVFHLTIGWISPVSLLSCIFHPLWFPTAPLFRLPFTRLLPPTQCTSLLNIYLFFSLPF